MNSKLNHYYDAQEMFDDMTIIAKQSAQQEIDELSERERAINLCKQIFPNQDADKIITMIESKMNTFAAISKQYKSDLESGKKEHKDIFMQALGSLAFELQPYEYIVYTLYPFSAPLFHTILMWYKNYLTETMLTQNA